MDRPNRPWHGTSLNGNPATPSNIIVMHAHNGKPMSDSASLFACILHISQVMSFVDCPQQLLLVHIAKRASANGRHHHLFLSYVDCLHRPFYSHKGQLTSSVTSLYRLCPRHKGRPTPDMAFPPGLCSAHNDQWTFDMVLQNYLWLAHKVQPMFDMACEHLPIYVVQWNTSTLRPSHTYVKCVYLESDVSKWQAHCKQCQPRDCCIS